MLRINKLNKRFDGVQAVNNFSLDVQPGKVTSIIGPNGAGKTTLFNIISGFLPPDSGEVNFQDVGINGQVPWRIVRRGISRTFQELRLFKKLTVLENVILGMQKQKGENFLFALVRYSSTSLEQRENVKQASGLIEFVGLQNHEAGLAENLSYGQQKLLSIACCLAAQPQLLMLDEPVAGVQPAMIEKIETLLRTIVSVSGKTVLLIEHDIEFVRRISDKVIVMDEGKLIVEGDCSVLSRQEILEAYLT